MAPTHSLPQCNRSDEECPHGSLLVQIKETQEKQGESIDKIERAIVGDIEDNRPGMFDTLRDHHRRLSSLESEGRRRQKRVSGLVATLLTTWIGLAGVLIWNKLFGKTE